MVIIESAQNPKIKFITKLQSRRGRKTSGLFVIEGYRELSRAHVGKAKITQAFICEDLFLGENEWDLLNSIGCDVFHLPKSLFEKISYRDRPDGLIAIAEQMDMKLSDIPKVDSPLYIIAEAIEKPGNLGTIMRSSDAVGATAVIVCDRCTDIYNPNVVRASVGTLFTQPVIETSSEEAFAFLKEQNARIVAATPAAKETYTKTNLSGAVAIAVGTEQLGLSDKWMEKADVQVSIPMLGVADSLNVASATTLLLYETLRQRGIAE